MCENEPTGRIIFSTQCWSTIGCVMLVWLFNILIDGGAREVKASVMGRPGGKHGG